MISKIIDNTESIESLRSEWESLLDKSGAIPVFLTTNWATGWLRFLSKRIRPFILTAWNGDAIEALCPLGLNKTFFVNRLEFLGQDDGDYLDFIVSNGDKEKCIEVFISFLKERKRVWDICDLKDMPEESENYNALYKFLKRYGWKAILYNTWSCSYLKIDGNWDGFLKRHGRKFRYNIKRERKQLERSGKLEFKKVYSNEELDYYLPQVFDIHKRRWNGFYIASKFSQPEGHQFYSVIAKDYLKKGMLRLDLLLLKGEIIAFSYSFQWRGRYLYYTPSYDPDYARYSPGKILLLYLLEDSFKSGLQEFDFCKGDLPYKSHWTTGERQNKRIIFASPTLKGKITFYIYLFYLNLFSRVRRLKTLRILLGRLKWLHFSD